MNSTENSNNYIFVIGGSGYIGSVTALQLLDNGYKVVIIDREENSFLQKIPNYLYEKADLNDKNSLLEVFQKYPVKGVIHFAAYIEVGESQSDPQKYYLNNLVGTLNLLEVMRANQVNNLVFSSTAAVYGLPKKTPILETDLKEPINTYGKTKWMVEQILEDYYRSYGFQSVRLRYFNASGADLKNRTGEMHDPESHLIPIILETMMGKRKALKIYGDNYQTPDGTCIRDYIHVVDLAAAHLLALEKLMTGKIQSEAINLGTSAGFSVKKILETVELVTGQKVPFEIVDRRPGDPDVLIASNQKAKNLLNWEPKYSDLETIIKTAWEWSKLHE